MNNTTIFLIIFVFLLIFISVQVYFYYQKYNKNNKVIQKMEQYTSKLNSIDNKDYILDDTSMERLLDDYENIKYNTF